jgi:hypothetical protein
VALLVLKLVLVPLLIGAVSLANTRLGPRRAGVLTGLPIVAGPTAFWLATEQGPRFGVIAAQATLAGELSLAVFCVLYARACERLAWGASLAVALFGYAASTLCMQQLSLPFAVSLSLGMLSTPLVLALAPRPSLPARPRAVPRRELALRMSAGALLVLALSAAAPALGPRLSGLLTIFPVATSVLAVSAQRAAGAAEAQHLLRGLAAGLYCLTAFFAALALLLEQCGVALAFSLALGAALSVQIGVLALAAPRPQTPAPGG